MTVLHKLLRPTDTRARGGSEPAQLPVRPGSPGGRRCRCRSETRSRHGRPPRPTTVSPSPGRPEHGPNAETAGEAGAEQVDPPAEPQSLLVPEPTLRLGRTGPCLPGEASRSPAGPWVPPGRAERAPEPHSTRAPCVRGHPPHRQGARPRVPDPPRRSVRLRLSPGPVPFPSRAGKRFRPPVAERSRDEPRGKFTAPRAGAGLSRRSGRGPRDPAAPPAPAGPRQPPALPGAGGAARPPARCLFVSEQLGRSREAATGPRLRYLHPTREGAAGAGPAPTPRGPRACPETGPYPELRSRVGSLPAGPGRPLFPPLSLGTPRCRAPRPPTRPRCRRGCCRRGHGGGRCPERGGTRCREGSSQWVPGQRCPRGAAPSHSRQLRNSRARKFSCRRV